MGKKLLFITEVSLLIAILFSVIIYSIAFQGIFFQDYWIGIRLLVIALITGIVIWSCRRLNYSKICFLIDAIWFIWFVALRYVVLHILEGFELQDSYYGNAASGLIAFFYLFLTIAIILISQLMLIASK